MKIETIEVEGVRALQHFSATFQPQFNLIVGRNATGKTTVLTIIARLLSLWTPKPMALLKRGDRTETIREGDGSPFLEVQGEGRIRVSGRGPDGVSFDGEYRWEGSKELLTEITRRRDRWLRSVHEDTKSALPLLVLFSPYRDPPRRRAPRRRIQEPLERISGYDEAFDLWADVKNVMTWFRTFDMAAIQESRSFPAVDAARQAIARCLPDCRDVRYLVRFDDVMIQRMDGTFEPMWRLSDGYRTMAALVGELAWRASILNPVGDSGTPENIEGVVLIDELDLHLHPEWQRSVVDTLREAFPKVQFIATTHSPFVVQSMRRDEVINLDGHAPLDYWRAGIEDIAVEAMGVDEGQVPRSSLYRTLEVAASEYYQLLATKPASKDEIVRQRAELDRLEVLFTDDPAIAAFLRANRLASKGERR